ncbi:CshA/CshB family fibrillar adhesin-related protein [Actinokineospora sp. NPDC004072]
MGVPAARGEFATGGAGRFIQAIDWFSWGAHGEVMPAGGFSRTQTRTVGRNTIAVTCTVSDVVSNSASGPNLVAYRPGTYHGDGFDDMYNIGGTGTANQLVVGLSTSLRTVSFDFDCSATLDGAPFPLAGLVLADAEQMNSLNLESIQATIAPSATWRIIDRYRSPGCTGQTELTRSADNALRIGRSTVECTAGPTVVAFMDGASSAAVQFTGSGTTAIALGVVLSLDHGDAPASYGGAEHLEQYGFAGGTVPTGAMVPSYSPDLTLATSAQPPVRLGATVDPEDTSHTSADATGDDTSGNGVFGPPDDEDAIAAPGTVQVVPGGAYALTGVACSGTATVAGWIDWNHDGDFDAGEGSAPVPCDGSVDLSWTVPADVQPALAEPTFLRLRIAADAAEVRAPTGVARSGEVEDYALRVAVPTITVVKSLPGRVDGDDQFTVAVTRDGSPVASATTTGEQTSATAGPVAVQPGGGYRITDTAGPGTNPADYVPSIACVETLTGRAVTPSGAYPEWVLPAVDADDQVRCTVVNTLARPSILLVKDAGPLTDVDGDGPDAGDTVEFTFTVTNSGNVPLDPVAVVDSKVGPVPCPDGPLAPRESIVCGPVAYPTTQADVDAGTVANTATATGTAPSGAEVTSTDSTTTPIPVRRAILLDKAVGAVSDADGNGPDAGDTLTFTYAVTNTGNVSLDPVVVDDPVVGPVTCPAGPLAPGVTIACDPVTRPLTQAEVDAGVLANTATATGTAPDGGTATSTDHTTTSIAAVPALSLAKAASAVSDGDGNGPDPGDTIAYTFTVTNTGNVTLDPVVVDDPTVGPVTCPSGPLAPGDSVVCTATPFSLDQADVDAGEVVNTAQARGTAPSGQEVTDEDTVRVPVAAEPSIGIVKVGSAVSDGDGNGHDVGDTIAYTFTVTNTGNVTLDPVAVDDPTVGPVTCPGGALAPGASIECMAAPYPLTQADVDAGEVVNTATATGQPPSGGPVTATDTATVAIVRAPLIGLTKAVSAISDLDGNGLDAGDAVTYSFTVTNTGNVTLNPVTVDDPTVGPVTCPAGPLAPGASIGCTAALHPLTQADVDAGQVANTATASGTDPTGAVVTAEDSATVPIPVVRDILLDKTASAVRDLDGNGPDTGDTITFGFAVTNTGNVTLNPVTVDDPTVGPVTCPGGPLAPGASIECTAAPYSLTQADVDAGAVTNTATATGIDPSGAPVSSSDTTRTLIDSAGAIHLVKTVGAVADTDGNGADAGDTVSYTLVVTNTGPVVLHAITVVDPMLGEVTCPAGPLAPGASVTCTARPYTVTQADVDARKIENTAVATGMTPGGQVVTDTDSAIVPLPAIAVLRLHKAAALDDANGDGLANPGETIAYTFTVTNIGAVTVTRVEIVDLKLDQPARCPATPLAPGASLVCTGTNTVTLFDVIDGRVTNLAVAKGRTPDGIPVLSPPATTTVPAKGPGLPIPPPLPGLPEPPVHLPPTGSAVGTALLLGLLFLALGAGSVLATRKRREP